MEGDQSTGSPRPVSPRGSPWKPWLLLFLKLSVTAALCAWLFRSGLLEFARVRVLLSNGWLLGATLLLWLSVTVGLSAFRYSLILRLAGAEPSPLRVVFLQMLGLFYNAVVPGNVGGDVIKNYYVLGGQPKVILPLVLLERLLGLLGLLTLAVALSPLAWVAGEPSAPGALVGGVRQLALLVWLVFGLALLGLGGLLAWARRGAPGGLGAEGAPGGGAGPLVGHPAPEERSGRAVFFIAQRLGALRPRLQRIQRYLSRRPRLVLGALALSVLIHAGDLLYFFAIARHTLGQDADLVRVGLTFPFGMLSFVLPISFSGLGVGHVAFEQLFTHVGLSQGANVFHVYICGLLAPMLLGALPAVFLRAEPRRDRAAD
jgi:hypothetical protein